MRTLVKNEEPIRRTVNFVPPAFRPAGQARNIHRTLGEDGICVLTFDRPNSSANIWDWATLEEFRGQLDFVAGAPEIKGLILISAKPSIFIAGADLHQMTETTPLDELQKFIELGQAQIARLPQLPMPTVSAIHGAAMGGGCEVALACDYRLASSDRATKIGLPETNLGLLPAWGGATRLPRLIGLSKALDFILPGKTLAARQALKIGIVDEVVAVEQLLAAARRKIREGKPRRASHWLTNNRLAAAMLDMRLRGRLLQKTRGNYPAVIKAVEVMTRGIAKPVAASLSLEREAILELVQTEACHNLMRLFFMQERAKKRTLENAGPQIKTKSVTRAAVIGAGVMGAGIAQWLSARGLRVILRDISADQVARGMSSMAQIYREGVKRHTFSPREARDGLDRIFPAPAEVSLQNIDLVIEAAVENLDLKKKIFQRLDELAGDETILATNTSALSISKLADATRRPERVIGLHFFNPVHRMQLVEIVTGRQTAPEVTQRTLAFAQKIGKLPVVVKDSPGFLVNRILMPYLIQAGELFERGAGLADLDEAMLDFGMPMGPMRLLDEVGVDVALHVAQTVAASFSDRMTVPAVLGKLAGEGLLGRKSGRGFYLYGESKQPRANPRAEAFVLDRTAQGRSREEIKEQLVFLMINEAARCLEEGIVAAPEDVDFAMIMGTGFAPFRGGPLRHADGIGEEKLVGAMEHLAQGGANQFKPCALLQNMAREGTKFYTNP